MFNIIVFIKSFYFIVIKIVEKNVFIVLVFLVVWMLECLEGNIMLRDI